MALARKLPKTLTKVLLSPGAAPFHGSHGRKMANRLLDVFAPLPRHAIIPKAALDGEDREFCKLGFTFALIGLSVRLLRLGSELTRDEYLSFCDLFGVTDDECPKLRRLFALAWNDGATHEAYARQMMYLYPDRAPLYRQVVTQLCRLAAANGAPDGARLKYISDVARIFGLNRAELGDILERTVHASEPDPYEVLNLPKEADAAQIKRRYHELMRRYHPDHVMSTARYPETVALSLMKAQAVNSAYGVLSENKIKYIR